MTPDSISIVNADGPAATIVLGSGSTRLERLAGKELSRYIHIITGHRLPIEHRPGSASTNMLLGSSRTHPIIAELTRDGAIALPEELDDTDGFALITTRYRGLPCLVIACGRGPACLYAVYHLLAQYCHVGFFGDRERVPRRRDLTLPSMHDIRLPWFEGRQNLQGCSAFYTSRYWDWDDWRREIDWSVKRGFNVLHVSLGARVLEYEAWRAIGVDAEPPTTTDRVHADLARQCTEYAHDLGLRVATPAGTTGLVPLTAREAHPEATFFEMQWFDYTPQLFLHPSDPLFEQLLATRLRLADQIYGPSELYSLDVYAEMEPPGTLEEREEAKRAFSRAAVAALRKHKPQAKWVVSGWGFVERKYWPMEHIRAVLEPFPDDMLVLNDLTSNYTTSEGLTRLYRETDGFFGKTWGWTVFHCFGGNTHLHGDLPGLIEGAQEVRAYPSAKWSYHAPEAIRHNALYYDLACQLAWKPANVSLEGFLRDYAVRRYGEEGANAMFPVLERLVETVYSWYDMNDWHGPIYQFTPVDPDKPWWHKRAGFVPVLRQATEAALAAAPLLESEACYQRDLVDIAKEYAGNVVTAATIDLWRASDECSFWRLADRVLLGLDAVQAIVSALPEYRIQEEIERATRPPYDLPREQARREIRTRYTVLIDFEHYDTLLDYARRDMYELVKHYYRPRMELLIGHVAKSLEAKRPPSQEWLHDSSRDIARQFIEGSPEETATPYPEVMEVVPKTILPLLSQEMDDFKSK